MARSVIKFANAGFDVRRCADRHLLFSTEFESLNVMLEGSATLLLTPGNPEQTLVVHNAGYFPVFDVFRVLAGKSFFHAGSSAEAYFYARTTTSELRIGCSNFGGEESIEVTFYFYIYVNPIEKNIAVLNKNTPALEDLPTSAKSGIVSVKENFTLAQSLPKNKNIDTDFPSYIIHKQEFAHYDYTLPDAPFYISVPHDLGYYPMFKFFLRRYEAQPPDYDTYAPTNYYESFNIAQAELFEAIGTQAMLDEIAAYGTGVCDYSCIILKGRAL